MAHTSGPKVNEMDLPPQGTQSSAGWAAEPAEVKSRSPLAAGRRLTQVLVGDFRLTSIEQRLFNTITLLNGVSNVLGAAMLPRSGNYVQLLTLQLVVGALFLLLYGVGRRFGRYRTLYWPFVLLTLSFLLLNIIGNAGTMGGAHYYLIPALVIAVILSPRTLYTLVALALFLAGTAAILRIEQARPPWFMAQLTPEQRLSDVGGNLIFAQLFTAALVVILAKNLNSERHKSDLLLLNILPQSVADELKRTDQVRPVDFENASVLFTDFAGFTHIAEGMTPQVLVGELDRCFRQFDRIVRRRNLEKIKTIGDSYMAVGGIPGSNRTHAVDCVLAALEVQWSMEAMRDLAAREGRPMWQVRIGVHTGDLVAGVIGWQKFAYDVWGDTVNTASRMESAGAAGRVNISGATQAQVCDYFDCECRGLLPVKGKGDVHMYFVNGIRPELSVDRDGRTPNAEFARLYRELARSSNSRPTPHADPSAKPVGATSAIS